MPHHNNTYSIDIGRAGTAVLAVNNEVIISRPLPGQQPTRWTVQYNATDDGGYYTWVFYACYLNNRGTWSDRQLHSVVVHGTPNAWTMNTAAAGNVKHTIHCVSQNFPSHTWLYRLPLNRWMQTIWTKGSASIHNSLLWWLSELMLKVWSVSVKLGCVYGLLCQLSRAL